MPPCYAAVQCRRALPPCPAARSAHDLPCPKPYAPVLPARPIRTRYAPDTRLRSTIFFWSTITGSSLTQAHGAYGAAAHDKSVLSLAWHPLGHLLCSGAEDNTLKFWSRNRPHTQARAEGGARAACRESRPLCRTHRGGAGRSKRRPITGLDSGSHNPWLHPASHTTWLGAVRVWTG